MMFRKPRFAVIVVSAVLAGYCALIGLGLYLPIACFIFAISPFLIAWMAFSIIKYGSYPGKELKENEEWGYQDMDKEKLGVF